MATENSNSGGFFGGAASGISDAQTQMLALRKQDALDQNEIRTAATKQIDDVFKNAKEMVAATAQAGKDPSALLPLIEPMIASLTTPMGPGKPSIADAAGIPAARPGQMATLLVQRPALEDSEGKKKIVTTSGGLGEPDRMHVFDERKGTVTPLDPKTGQPMLSPSEVITPRQAQIANPPAAPPVTPVPPPDASLPPGAAPTQGDSPVGMRFVEPAPPAQPINPSLNYDAIEKYSPKTQGVIKGISDGTVDLTKFSKRILKGEQQSEFTKFLEAVKEYDPSFDMANYRARATTLNSFKSGVEARKVSALGTVVGHVTELAAEGKKLNNWKSDTFGPATKAANEVRRMIQEGRQSPAITRFDNAATAVANELETAFRGNTTAISGIQEWRKGINAGMADDQIAESTKSLGKLLLARMGELKEQWDRGMGHNQDPTIATKLAITRQRLEQMAAGTLLTDKEVNRPDIKPLKDKYGLQ